MGKPPQKTAETFCSEGETASKRLINKKGKTENKKEVEALEAFPKPPLKHFSKTFKKKQRKKEMVLMAVKGNGCRNEKVKKQNKF